MRYLFALLALSALQTLHAITPAEALDRLQKGNQRYVSEKFKAPDTTSYVRKELLSQQKPFAIILGCSDSRVPPEIIFNEGLGDLFTIRIAGQVLDQIVLDSIEYAVTQLGSVLIVVLGHERCGAVDATLTGKTQGIEAIAKRIEPAVSGASTLEAAIHQNINFVLNQIKASPTIFRHMQKGNLGVVGAYYNLSSGQVEIFLPL